MNKGFAILLLVLAACNYDVGECWLRDEDGDSSESGVINPTGGGGFGDVPLEPLSTREPSDPCSGRVECRVNWKPGADPCEGKTNCKTLYQGTHTSLDEAQEACEKVSGVKTGSGAESCDSCHWVVKDDPVERCKKVCDKMNLDCIARCRKGDKNCMNECNQKNGKCLRDCER
jgi:hypothetical protein